MRARPRFLTAAVAAALALVAACGGGDDEPIAGSTSTPSASATTDATATTTGETAAPSTAEPTTTPTTADDTYPTTTVHQPPAACEDELDEMLAVVDESIESARLVPGGEWSDDMAGSTFDDRTHSADEFRYRLGLDCSARLAQRTPGGDDRLVLAAWTGDRRAWVVQATDSPPTAYPPVQRIELFIDQPYGEWLVDQYVWAGSLDTGETVVVGTVDTSFGLTAKSWWSEVDRFVDLEVTNAAERYAIDALVHAGARNVSVAEPADFGSEIAAIQYITPLGLILIGTTAPPDWFAPDAAIVEGEMVVERIGGVDVHVTTAVPDSYAVGSVGWRCGDYVWFIDSVYGTVDELTDWTAQLIESTQC